MGGVDPGRVRVQGLRFRLCGFGLETSGLRALGLLRFRVKGVRV